MNTAEMWMQANKDGKWYRMIEPDNESPGDIVYYHKNFGLVDRDMLEYELECWSGYNQAFNELMNQNWVVDNKIMTKVEAEEKFCITIIGD